MIANRQHSKLLIAAALGSILTISISTIQAAEQDSLIPASGLDFGLQVQVQDILNQQIDHETTDDLTARQLMEKAQQQPMLTKGQLEKKSLPANSGARATSLLTSSRMVVGQS